MRNIRTENGYTLLLIVLIVSGVALAIGLYLRLQDITKTDSIITEQKAFSNFIEAQSCLEEGIRRLKLNPATYRNDSFTRIKSSCTIAVTGTSPDYTIDITAAQETLVKKLRANAVLSGATLVSSTWREIP
ncbi:MAG: hypothetical protein HY422_02240 [Candidatus Komeilibacteria bacterium]|nr:hypothetical protein [Candidatus Komeilibacteria bacterium]